LIAIAERIEVLGPPNAVWDVLSDPAEVISCISGAQMGDYHDDGTFDATLGVRFGGLRVAFGARVRLDRDHEAMEQRLTARGADRQGATRVASQAIVRVHEAANGSIVTVDGSVDVSGKLASVIDAGAGVVVTRMTRDFGASLAARCAPPERTEPVAAPAPRRGRLRAWLMRLLRRRS
jgi:carbon monoxide dehydrogenase subunit G